MSDPASQYNVDLTLPRTSVVVMKFGGTSVQDAAAIQRSISIVKGRRDAGLQPIVVVSAMAGVTDGLLAAAEAASQNRIAEAMAMSQALRARHVETAAALVGRNIVNVAKALHQIFDKLDDILRGIGAVGELTHADVPRIPQERSCRRSSSRARVRWIP